MIYNGGAGSNDGHLDLVPLVVVPDATPLQSHINENFESKPPHSANLRKTQESTQTPQASHIKRSRAVCVHIRHTNQHGTRNTSTRLTS